MYYKKTKKKENEILSAIILGFALSIPTVYHDNITKYFAKQQPKQQLCGTVRHIQYSHWHMDYFFISNSDLKFNLSQYQKAKINDKICMTIIPDEKWFGYAYILKVEKL